MMTMTLDFTPTEQARVAAAAQQRGLDLTAFIKQIVTEHLPPVPRALAASHSTERDPDLVARVQAIRGKYAHTVKEAGSEELHRERQRDKEMEEVQLRGVQSRTYPCVHRAIADREFELGFRRR